MRSENENIYWIMGLLGIPYSTEWRGIYKARGDSFSVNRSKT